MILLVVLFLLAAGALGALLVPPQRRAVNGAVSLVPAAALAALLLPLPLRESFSIAWAPASLFPDPILFQARPASVAYAAYLCCLLLLIEWTRPMRRISGRAPRVVIFLLTISGLSACFASTPLAVILSWAIIDFLSFLAIFFLKSPVEIGPEGLSSSLSHSMGILTVNMLGTILVLFSLFTGRQGSPSDWGFLGSASPVDLAKVLFLAGIALRLVISPLQFTFSRIRTTSTGVEILLRIISPAAGLCLLANIWPHQAAAAGGTPGFTWAILPLSLVILAAGWQWAVSSSAYSRRDNFFLILPGFALLSAIVSPRPEGIFPAAGAILILGGGILLVHLGYLPHRRWTAVFPLLLGFFLSGIPFSPMSVWSASVYPGLFSAGGIPALLTLALCQVFILAAVFRLALESVEEFPSNEPLFLATFSLGMAICLSFLLYPGWREEITAASAAVSVLLLLCGILLIFLVRRFFRTGASLFLRLEDFFRLEWLQRGILGAFRGVAILVTGAEAFLSGEGAMLWSLGIALLLYLVFRGG
jgi:hypothetical protein